MWPPLLAVKILTQGRNDLQVSMRKWSDTLAHSFLMASFGDSKLGWGVLFFDHSKTPHRQKSSGFKPGLDRGQNWAKFVLQSCRTFLLCDLGTILCAHIVALCVVTLQSRQNVVSQAFVEDVSPHSFPRLKKVGGGSIFFRQRPWHRGPWSG